jgi:putative two-component system response regulator
MAEQIATLAARADNAVRIATVPDGGGVWADPLEDGSRAPTVLVVDQNATNRKLLRVLLRPLNCVVLEAARPSSALSILESEQIDLVVTEIVSPEIDGLELCRRLKSRRSTRLIPILILTSVPGVEYEVAGMESGADEFLTKPLPPPVIRTRVRALLRNKRLLDSLDEAESILFGLAQSVEHRDRCTGAHCGRLAAYSVALGRSLGLGQNDLLALYRGGYLHDIGKIGVSDAVLFKRAPLNEEEWREMRTHTLRGEEICRPMRSLAPVLPVIRSHHEKWDGSGYPDGLCGDAIPLLARILQIADIYDALTTERPYKLALPHNEAVCILSEEARRGWRDPRLVSAFLDLTRSGPPRMDVVPGLEAAIHAGATTSLIHLSQRVARAARA